MPRAIWSRVDLVRARQRPGAAVQRDRRAGRPLPPSCTRRTTRGSGTRRSARRRGKPVPDDEIVRGLLRCSGGRVRLRDRRGSGGGRGGDVSDDRRPGLRCRGRSRSRSIFERHELRRAQAAGGEKTYALLVRAMEESGLVGIASYVMRDKQQLGCLGVQGRDASSWRRCSSPTRSGRRTRSRRGRRGWGSRSSRWRST